MRRRDLQDARPVFNPRVPVAMAEVLPWLEELFPNWVITSQNYGLHIQAPVRGRKVRIDFHVSGREASMETKELVSLIAKQLPGAVSQQFDTDEAELPDLLVELSPDGVLTQHRQEGRNLVVMRFTDPRVCLVLAEVHPAAQLTGSELSAVHTAWVRGGHGLPLSPHEVERLIAYGLR